MERENGPRPQLVVIVEIAQLGVAVFAGGRQDRRAGFFDLIDLDPGRLHSEIQRFLPQGHQPAAAAAAPVVFRLGGHFPEIVGQVLQNVARLVDDPAVAGDLAGIVVGDRLR